MATALTLLALAFIFIVGAVIVSKVPEPGQPHNFAVKLGRAYFPLAIIGVVASLIASSMQDNELATGASLTILILSVMAAEVVWFRSRI